MNVLSIKFHIDSGISIHCERNGADNDQHITPEHLKSVTVLYEISLINDPLKKVKEQCRINNRNIEYNSHYFTLFFPLENILQPHESQITFRSLTFYFKDYPKVNIPLVETYTFSELQKNGIETTPESTTIDKNQGTTHKNLQEGVLSTSGTTSSPSISLPHNPISPVLTTKEELKLLFEDSYKKFQADLQNSSLQDLLKSKQSTFEFNMKNFGISLLCKLLLLVKYFNVLVDNDFQEDLNAFLQHSMGENKKMEGVV
ncbi:MAG: hypothetical protein ACFFFT_00285 [Candidatus Thorarchaeota archaeon]